MTSLSASGEEWKTPLKCLRLSIATTFSTVFRCLAAFMWKCRDPPPLLLLYQYRAKRCTQIVIIPIIRLL
jgi:hypothetical protein